MYIFSLPWIRTHTHAQGCSTPGQIRTQIQRIQKPMPEAHPRDRWRFETCGAMSHATAASCLFSVMCLLTSMRRTLAGATSV